MNIRDLSYLIAVVEHQHFGKAAAACFVSQPTLSMQLKKLEEFLGVQLIERSNKQVIITPIGLDIAAHARVILQEVNTIKEAAKAASDPLAGELKIGVFPTLAPYLLPRIVPTIIKQYPKLTLLLVEEKTERLHQQLQQGKLDMCLMAMPIGDDQLHVESLFSEPFYLATSKQHPYAKHKVVTKKDLMDQHLLLLEDGHCLREQALDVCAMSGSRENQNFRATSLETLRQMVVANVGMTLIPKLAINKESQGIVYIPFDDKKFSRTIGLFWRKHSVRKSLFLAVADLIKKCVKQD